MNRLTVFRTAVIMTGIASAVSAAPARADQWSKTYQVNGRAELHVMTGDGDVVVTGADQQRVDARVTTTGWKIGPNDWQIIESQAGNSFPTEVKVPRGGFSMLA